MSKQRSLRIDERFDRFIDERVASERYETAEDVVQAGLALLEEQELALDEMAKAFDARPGTPWTLETLREAIRQGEESGEAKEVHFDLLFREVEAETSLESKRPVAF